MTAIQDTEALAHLRLSGYPTEGDDIIDVVAAAEAAIAKRCGPLEPVEFVETLRGSRRILSLRNTPVLSVESVTPTGGSALPASSLDVDGDSGTIGQANGGMFTSMRYRVAYTAGRQTLPDDLKYAVLELVRHMWATQRGNAPGVQGALPDDGETLAAVIGPAAFPPRVEQLIVPHVQVAI